MRRVFVPISRQRWPLRAELDDADGRSHRCSLLRCYSARAVVQTAILAVRDIVEPRANDRTGRWLNDNCWTAFEYAASRYTLAIGRQRIPNDTRQRRDALHANEGSAIPVQAVDRGRADRVRRGQNGDCPRVDVNAR